MTYETCALCRKQKELKKSHIIPRFVAKWLKSTSATGFLRGAVKPEMRRQDLPTLPMLCGECEQIFSKLELYFAREIFYPFMNEGKRNIAYDDTLIRFIISLSWRTLKAGYEVQVSHTPWIKKHIDKAEEVWRKFLLNESLEVGPYEHHMFFLDYVEKGPGMPPRFQWYTLRATDSTLVSNENDIIFAYTHFPWVFFVSTIFPLQLLGWNGTRINKQGKTAMRFEIGDGRFGSFLLDRSKIVSSSTQKTDNSNDERILKSLSKNPERFLNSESFKVMMEESRRERQEKLKTLPAGVVELISIIDRSLDSPILNSLQQKWLAYAQNLVANELANLTNDKATEIHSLIYAALRASSITRIDMHCTFETTGIIGRFMVCFSETKNEQIELAEKALDEMIKKRASKDKRFIIVFTFNPLDEVLPYETMYYLE
jgi:hypothetical protein